jgi:aminomethyltransferase
MPVQYSSIVEEHRAARETAALFDVSHMGQIALAGATAATCADRLCTRAMSTLASGRVRYALLCNESGGVIDDLTVYRTGAEEFFLCVNAANTASTWPDQHAPAGVACARATRPGCSRRRGASASCSRRSAARHSAGFRGSRSRAPPRAATARSRRAPVTPAPGFELYRSPRDAAPLFRRARAARTDSRPRARRARPPARGAAAHGQELDADTRHRAGSRASSSSKDFGAPAMRAGATPASRARWSFEIADAASHARATR